MLILSQNSNTEIFISFETLVFEIVAGRVLIIHGSV